MKPTVDIDPVDKAFIAMLERKTFEIVLQDSNEYTIEDETSSFELVAGQVYCTHKNWTVETDEQPSSNPDSSFVYETKYALCDDCEEDVTEEVGLNDPPEEDRDDE